ncbi:MAG: oligosaccharide flippase family protein [Holophagales bacterium]|nr:MAG: oligosaccharide flippase family protein [Holophagales bacterium]
MSTHDPARGLLRSSSAATLAQFWRMGLMLATNIFLRRLLPREDWGVWGWVETVFLVLAALRDLGLPSHVVRLDPPPYGTLVRFQLGWGILLAVGVAFAAPSLALLFHDPVPTVVPVLRAMTVFMLLEGLASVPLTYLERELRIQRTLLPELVRSLAYTGTAVALAVAGRGVWSLVIAQLVAAAAYTAVLWGIAARSMPLTRSSHRLVELLRGSLPLGSVWLLQLGITYLDPWILGARFASARVAEYLFAYFFGSLATRVMQQPVARALYPAFVALRSDPARKVEAYRLGTLLLAALEVPAACVMFVNPELLLSLVGGQQWVEAPGYLRILAFAPLIDPFGRFGGELLIALHRDRLRVVSLAASLLSVGAAGWALTSSAGPGGMAWARYLVLGAPVVAWGVWSFDPAGFRRLARDLVEVYLVPLPLFAATWWLTPAGSWLRLLVSAAAALVCLAWSWRRFGSSFQTFFRFGAMAGARQ